MKIMDPQELERFSLAILDALSSHIAILNADGRIAAVNEAWRRFALENGATGEAVNRGADYLGVCDRAVGPDAQEARTFAEGIRSVMSGRCEAFEMEYACHSEVEQRWFIGRVTRFPGEGSCQVVVAHENITARRLAEEKLLANKAQLDLALTSSRMGMWRWEITENKRYFDDQVCRLLGLNPATFDGTPEAFFGAVHPDDRKKIKAALAETLARDVPYELEYRVVWPDGSIHYVGARGKCVRDALGQPLRILGIIWDITERKRAEEMLRASDDRFRESDQRQKALLDSIPDPAWLKDNQGRFLAVNQAWCNFMGSMAQEVIGKTLFDLLPYETARAVTKSDQDAMLFNRELRYEEQIPNWHGELCWFETFKIPIRNEVGAAVGVVGIARNITERKPAEEALRQSEARFRAFFESNVIGILFGDVDGRVYDCNDEMARISGRTRQEVQAGKVRWTEITPPEDLPLDERAIAEALATGRCTPYEKHYIRPDGTRVSVLVGYTLLEPERHRSVAFIMDITERKRAEEALRESEENYRLLFNSIHDAVFLHEFSAGDGVPGRFIQVNDVACQRYGYSREEWLHMRPQDLDAPEGLAAIPGVMRQLLAQGHATWEGMHRAKDGRLVPVEISNVLFDYRGAPMILSAVRDITERKQAEALLRREQGLYKDLVNTIPVGTYRLRMKPAADWKYDNWESRSESHYSVEMASDRFCEITGLSRQEFEASAKSVPDRIHPDDHLGFVQRNTDAVTSLSPFNWEGRMVLPDQRTVWVHFESIPRLLDNGEVIWTGIAYDITERKRAEESLRESEERFRSYFESPLIGNAMTSPDKGWLEVNDQLCEILGYSREELMRMTWSQITHPEDLPADLEQFSRVQTGQIDGYSIEKRFIRKDGRMIHASLSVRCLRKANGEIDYFVVLLQDITERKRAEEEREKLQAQLLQAQKMESVGRLAGGVAHDFNNMLGVILGHAEMALEEVQPSQPLYDNLAEIQKAAQRSADLTRQLLAFARKQTIAPKDLDLNETIAGMLKMLQRIIGENISLTWEPGVNLWPVKMDPSQLDQILANLCVNARDAIANIGRITIKTENTILEQDSLSYHSGFQPGEYVRLTVSDNGCGMDKETMAHIFEPFYTTKGVGAGTGLGLATVYGAIKQNHGFIYASSEPGRGTTFTIHLPRSVNDKKESEPGETTTEAMSQGQETILLVEDESTILAMTSKILERQGYTVLAARGPEEAISLARDHRSQIRLLLTDVIMPDMNGRDLAEKLLALHPDLKRLFMSGYTADVISASGVLDKGVHFIQKPFTMAHLIAKVREALDSH